MTKLVGLPRGENDDPIVLARVSGNRGLDMPRAEKEAVQNGADIVLLDSQTFAEHCTEFSLELTPWGVTTGEEQLARHAATAGATLIDWRGEGRPEVNLPVLVRDRRRAKRGDGWCCGQIDALRGPFDSSEEISTLVDFGACSDRAELAALVTLARHLGANGFVTIAPKPVHRAAYVICSLEKVR